MRVTLLLLLDKPCFCRIAIETDCQICYLLNNIAAADFCISLLEFTNIKRSQLNLVENFIPIDPQMFLPFLWTVELLQIYFGVYPAEFSCLLCLFIKQIKNIFLGKGQFEVSCCGQKMLKNRNVVSYNLLSILALLFVCVILLFGSWVRFTLEDKMK